MPQLKILSSAGLVVLLCGVSVLGQRFGTGTRVERLIEVPFTVKDYNGKLVTGLSKDDFAVLEDGRPQVIENFSIDPVPLSVSLVIDTGLEEKSLEALQAAVPAIVGAFSEFDEVTLYRYDNSVTKLLDFTGDRESLRNALDQLRELSPREQFVGGEPQQDSPVINGSPVVPTAGSPLTRDRRVLHDAVYEAAVALRDRPEGRRRIVMLVSDGNDHRSEFNFEDTVFALMEGQVQVFAIALNTGFVNRILNPLDNYADATGGDVYFTGLSSLEPLFNRITEEARNQYYLSYYSTNEAPADRILFRNIDVRCDGPYEILHKNGYYQVP